jgi:hypothetical protein
MLRLRARGDQAFNEQKIHKAYPVLPLLSHEIDEEKATQELLFS